MFFRKRLKKYDPAKAEEKGKEIEREGGLEKKDMSAMMLSAVLTIVPVCLLVLLGIAFLSFLVFGLL